jgi:hypothetical protein
MLGTSHALQLEDCEPLLWHLVEARDAAIAATLIRTAEAIETAIMLVLSELKSGAGEAIEASAITPDGRSDGRWVGRLWLVCTRCGLQRCRCD